MLNAGTSATNDWSHALHRELHDSSQPLSRLQCRLEIGLLSGGEKALLEAVEGALEDVQLVIASFDRLRMQAVRLRNEEAPKW